MYSVLKCTTFPALSQVSDLYTYMFGIQGDNPEEENGIRFPPNSVPTSTMRSGYDKGIVTFQQFALILKFLFYKQQIGNKYLVNKNLMSNMKI